MPSNRKERLDIMLTRRGLAESREKAQRLIMAGLVTVNGFRSVKSGHSYPEDSEIEVRAVEQFVGRGGRKLEAAFAAFQIDVSGKVCIDVGASTGGFTDCLLQRGAARVYALDVGKGQLHWKLRQDSRVIVLEGINSRYLGETDLPESPQFATVDVSFISLTKVLGPVSKTLDIPADIVTLIKPQFEAGRAKVEKGGVVSSKDVHDEVITRVRLFGTQEQGLKWLGVCESPLRGPAGNVEFLAHWRKEG